MIESPKFEGVLPIRVLGNTLLKTFIETTNDFRNETEHEVTYNKLKRNIIWNAEQKKMSFLARITDEHQIQIEETFLAFLWSLSYVTVTFFQEQKAENYGDNKNINRAAKVFDYGFSLFELWKPWSSDLPNPEEFDIEIDPYINEANGVFLNAGKFILCHEYAHHLFDHFSTDNVEEMKNDEFAADKYACEVINDGFSHNSYMGDSINLGTLVGITSILFHSESWDGGEQYPDTDKRILNILNQMCKEDDNNDMWNFATSILLIWGSKFQKIITVEEKLSAKNKFISLLQLLKTQIF